MTEEECCVDLAFEPHVSLPKESLIHMELHSPRSITHPYKNLTTIKVLGTGKFPVLLVQNKDKSQQYAMKVFESQNEKAMMCFRNEVRFATLDHPNVIKTLHHEQDRRVLCNETFAQANIIITELAPYGDFFHLVMGYNQHLTEKLVRTYFQQLIQGMEYLHSLNIAHLDLKLDNLLMGEDYLLKIADFDLSCFGNERNIRAKGTRCFRAPEMIIGECKNVFAADVYSAGIILFVLKSGGRMPHAENNLYCGLDLYDLLQNYNVEFWRKHGEIGRKHKFTFSDDFKELFNGMTKEKIEERFTIREIKNSKWYRGEVYSHDELKRKMQSILSPK